MKKSISFFLVLSTGLLVLGLSGCTKAEEEDLTEWAIPLFEKKVTKTEKVVKPAGEAEQAIAESQQFTYVVKKGDCISAIAKQHRVSPLRLAEANGLGLEGSKSIIYPGQKLIIPAVNKYIYYYEK